MKVGDKVRFKTPPQDHGIVFKAKDGNVWVDTWGDRYRCYSADLFEPVSDEEYQGPEQEDV